MKLVAVSVGRPREIIWRGKAVRISIWKSPVTGKVRVRTLNLEGDEQSDLSVHGGADKAVYIYPSEHYGYWREQLPGVELPWGAFGENFTSEGLFETEVQIGDRLRVGTAEFVVTQPRLPCFKLGIRFDRPDLVREFFRARRTGFYLSVLREGSVCAGDAIERTAREDHGVTVADIVELYAQGSENEALLRRAVAVTALPDSWRAHFRGRLWEPDA
ncbi:MAG TPA: MOSC domain-containing protein [Candidatus Nitrosopolaris sp.]|nr:MOSC domain-containing protein [Candidatus Nitrosopolaris sp.]